jgi:Bacterial archaeo-eukaryotic release factor family 3
VTAGARGPLRTYRRAAGPTPETVLLLQAVRSYPSVSLLATTAPGPRMTAQDARTLHGLAEEAADRLRAEDSPRSTVVLDELGKALARATSGPTEQAIGVFVNAGMQKIVHLPVPVTDRAVVDPAFATRDLVRGLHRTPRHAVLVLTEREARLFEGVDDHLVPPARSGFPLTMPENRDANRAQVTAFLRIADRALGIYLRLHPAPLVLVGAQQTVAEFRRISRNTGRLAGTITCSFPSIPSAHLAPRIRGALERYLLSRQDEALQLVERRRRHDKVVEGLSAAWLAARWERPEMLAVEEGYFFPARISDDGDHLSAAEDTTHPDVVDDAVDELIETVLLRGGWVAFVDDGRLAKHGRVVLTTR